MRVRCWSFDQNVNALSDRSAWYTAYNLQMFPQELPPSIPSPTQRTDEPHWFMSESQYGNLISLLDAVNGTSQKRAPTSWKRSDGNSQMIRALGISWRSVGKYCHGLERNMLRQLETRRSSKLTTASWAHKSIRSAASALLG